MLVAPMRFLPAAITCGRRNWILMFGGYMNTQGEHLLDRINGGWTSDGRLTGQSALILGRGPEVSSVVAQSVECYKLCFSWGSKGLVHLKMTCSLLKHDSTTQLKNGATQLSLPRYWPVNYRLSVKDFLLKHNAGVVNDLPKLWFFGCVVKGAVTFFR